MAGTTNIAVVVSGASPLSGSVLFWAGMGLLLVGLAFKVGAVPFHMWIPDVYQGSPTTVAGFMSTGAKAAAFSAFVLVVAHQVDAGGRLRIVLSLLAASSMILGNIVAIAQTNIKRMLAYSSIAHAGYMLIGLAAGNQLGRSGIVFYLTAYTFMNVGAFGVLSLLEGEEEKHLTFADYAGLGSRRPLLAALMSVFMLSLAGLPPLAGFFGKYYIFIAAVNADLTWLAILGVLTSVVSAFYYLRVIMMMYFQPGETSVAASPASMAGVAALCAAALAVLELGLFPSSILTVINSLF
jgi:NADH-quinone oxidoreductase subunit N